MLGALRRTGQRALAGGVSPEPTIWQGHVDRFDPSPRDHWLAPRSSTVLLSEADFTLGREQLPANIVWMTAAEYAQQWADPTEWNAQFRNSFTKASLAHTTAIEEKLCAAADRYLTANRDIDDHSARAAWQRWGEEVAENEWYERTMRWRYQCFTEANLEVIPPGSLRETLRYTTPVDLSPTMQEEVWKARQEWLPARWRCERLTSPDVLARRSAAARKALTDKVEAMARDWSAKAKGPAEKAVVETVAAQWRTLVAPTAHITADSIAKCSDLATLQQWLRAVVRDNFDDRVFAICSRAASLRNDAAATKLAAWARGVAQRDAFAPLRRVEGVPFDPAPESEREKELAQLPAAAGEVTTDAGFAALRRYVAEDAPALAALLAPKEAWRGDAVKRMGAALDAAKAAGQSTNGRALRKAMWAATADAWAAAHPSLATTHYAPPHPPVRKDAAGSLYLLRNIGAQVAAGALSRAAQYDATYVSDLAALVETKHITHQQIAELAAEYPSLGMEPAALTDEQRRLFTPPAGSGGAKH